MFGRAAGQLFNQRPGLWLQVEEAMRILHGGETCPPAATGLRAVYEHLVAEVARAYRFLDPPVPEGRWDVVRRAMGIGGENQ